MEEAVFTIGHSTHSEDRFISLLRKHAVAVVCDVRSQPYSRINPQFNRENLKERLRDVRLNNVSQLAGFTKKDDLRYFARAICSSDYVHLPDLAPTPNMLDTYKKRKGDWATYEHEFLELMRQRRIEDTISKGTLASGCLLCSEEKPEHCHRRLVAEYLKQKWGDVEIHHIK